MYQNRSSKEEVKKSMIHLSVNSDHFTHWYIFQSYVCMKNVTQQLRFFFTVHLEWSHIALWFRLYTHKEKSLIRAKPLCPKFTNRPISTLMNSFCTVASLNRRIRDISRKHTCCIILVTNRHSTTPTYTLGGFLKTISECKWCNDAHILMLHTMRNCKH